MELGVLPFRAIAFQILFLLIAISLESLILYRRLALDYKTSVRHATTINLFSTFVGWIIFFNVQQVLPEGLRIQLISLFFFERVFPNQWSTSVTPMLTVTALGTFLGVVIVEYQGLTLLETLLETRKPQEETDSFLRSRDRFKMRRLDGGILFKKHDRAYTILVANSLSFSAILLVLLFRWLDQTLIG
uniref:Filament integrity protein fraC n=1 Tax=Oscillatoriales cyanobacterium SpSt-402 TaxID=2282168 RepID=A0A832H5W1_9CYAN